ncbi:hypothetical protein GCM10019993_19360 [Enterococcus pseudoavium]
MLKMANVDLKLQTLTKLNYSRLLCRMRKHLAFFIFKIGIVLTEELACRKWYDSDIMRGVDGWFSLRDN